MLEQQINKLVDHLFRTEAGKMASVLTRMIGLQHLELVEDLVQDTLLKALHTWKVKGVPQNPQAWLYTVAKRKAIDAIRKQKLHLEIEATLAQSFQSEYTFSPAVDRFFLDHEIEDSQLRMMFVCCHPSLSYEAQVALILKTLCGLSTAEIAHSFLTNEETITKRLYRAKEKIKQENLTFEIPSAQTLTSRLETVLHTLYLLFNEGYNSSHPDRLIRSDLCAEALRLGMLLTKNNVTNLPIVYALLSLMCFQASREAARLTPQGQIILLQDQNRNRWDKALIKKGNDYLNTAAGSEQFSEYHLEAAIAACHVNAPAFDVTDWKRIVILYDLLTTVSNDPIVALNKAIATSYAEGPEAGLQNLLKIKGLERHSFYHAALGDFYHRLQNTEQARAHYQKALTCTQSQAEIELLTQKLASTKD